jgi:UDP-N-acetylmuramate dehydrogenase
MALEIQKNKILANFSTFKIGGPAKYFIKIKDEKELIEAIEWAKKKKLPFFILGGGSNILFPDKGFNGLVIKFQNTKYEIRNTKIIAGAGCPLQKLVKATTINSLSGLEWAVGIPGTLGGAIRGNAGAFGGEMKNVVKKVKTLKIENCKFKIENLRKKECEFGYRESIFKKKKNWIILEAELKLKKGNEKEIQEKIKEILRQRKEKQPLEFPSAGSVFKNISIKKVPKEVREKFKEEIKNDFLPAAILIEECSLKGKTIGGAKISEKHANFILNFKKAKAKDVLNLIKFAKKKVRDKFKIDLEEEIELVGF